MYLCSQSFSSSNMHATIESNLRVENEKWSLCDFDHHVLVGEYFRNCRESPGIVTHRKSFTVLYLSPSICPVIGLYTPLVADWLGQSCESRFVSLLTDLQWISFHQHAHREQTASTLWGHIHWISISIGLESISSLLNEAFDLNLEGCS